MKNRTVYALLTTVTTLVGMIGVSQVRAHTDEPARPDGPMVSKIPDKPKLKIVCLGNGEDWFCKVRDKDNNEITGQVNPPGNIKERKPLFESVEADVPAHLEMQNVYGPHCWILVAGKWYMTHC